MNHDDDNIDIVERLVPGWPNPMPGPMAMEAANTIMALRAEVDLLNHRLTKRDDWEWKRYYGTGSRLRPYYVIYGPMYAFMCQRCHTYGDWHPIPSDAEADERAHQCHPSDS